MIVQKLYVTRVDRELIFQSRPSKQLIQIGVIRPSIRLWKIENIYIIERNAYAHIVYTLLFTKQMTE